jgi:hypothetical protein
VSSVDQPDPVASSDSSYGGPITLLGQSVGNATLVSVTYTSLLMCMGRLGEEDEASEVLVPFVEMKFDGPETEGGSAPALFSEILTLDNAAYILGDISSDLVTVCRQFHSVSSGKTAPEMRRLDATRRFFSEAKLNLEKCISELDAIIQIPR